MATSGTKTYSTTLDKIIKSAFLNAQIYRSTDSIPNEDYINAIDNLNEIIKAWKSIGFNIWNDRRAFLFTQYNTNSYNLGSTAHATESYVETALTNNELTGAIQLELDSTTGVSVGDNAGIKLNDGTLFWSTISGLGQITSYIENFSSDVGFTYDNTKTEFSGGQIQQKSQRPTNAVFGATYTSSINASWGNGSLTGTGTGTPVITGNKLDLSGDTLKYVDYNATSNVSIQTGAIKFKITPNYSGTPTSTKTFYLECKSSGDNINTISLSQVSGSGNLVFSIRDSSGVVIVNASLGVWNPTASTTYEFEINYDITAGANRLFIEGTQFGATDTNTGTRDSNIGLIRIGTGVTPSLTSDFFIEDLVRFNAVQHTANYTKGYTLQEYDYIEDLVSLPVSSGHDITETISFVVSQTSNARFNINGVYHNGSSWVLSDNSYAQMNTATQINTNIATLPATCCITIKMRMEASNIQSKVDNLVFTYADNTISAIRISLVTGITSNADSGNEVYIYTNKITKPFEITQCNLNQTSNNEITLTRLSRKEYYNLSNKTSTGNPNQFYYFRKRTDGVLFLWNTPVNVTQVISFTYQPYLDIFENQADEPDFPPEWIKALIWNLSSELCVPYGVSDTQYNKVNAKAQYWLEMARSSDNENSKLTFGGNY